MKRFRATLHEVYGPRLERVMLYGSRARGDARDDSDYGVAVFLRNTPDRIAELFGWPTSALPFLDETGAFIHAMAYPASFYNDPRMPLMYAIRDEVVPAIDAAKAAGAAALNFLASPLVYPVRLTVYQHMAALRLPAMYQWPDMPREGGLAGYGPSLAYIYGELLPGLCAQLLRGTKPADLPIEQPTKFELVINLKTANALDLTVPQSLLARADEVIE